MSTGGWSPRDDPPTGRRAARLPPYLQPRPYEAAGTTGGRHGHPGRGIGAAPPAYPSAGLPQPSFPSGPRPFVLTRGRVGDDISEIGPETQVTTTNRAIQAERHGGLTALSPELRAIVTICIRSASVAEISARLGLHLGVTKVLVSDLHADGHVVVHVADASSSNSTEIILRVMHGLRAIS